MSSPQVTPPPLPRQGSRPAASPGIAGPRASRGPGHHSAPGIAGFRSGAPSLVSVEHLQVQAGLWVRDAAGMQQRSLTYGWLSPGDAIMVSDSPGSDTMLSSNEPDPGMASREMDIAVIAGVIAAVAFVLVCLLFLMLHYMYRHKGTYHTNEAKGTEFAESADAALQDDPSLQDNGDSSRKEYFI
ncbi:PREDICTED: cell adhesion molecule 3-like [Lipotes vexillifer]|uniref:Cell adhesion molecule 3-like n=2 Tax=Odontoceti TaxID=9722 RepID=A0A340XPW4_LIPVE|nr:PREDICTED: cell adhesion molecule 3-like [Lipotes vexillifer]